VNQLIGETGEHQPKVAKQGEITFHVMQVGAETARKLEEELSKAGREAGRFIEPWSKLRAETDKYRETLVRLDTQELKFALDLERSGRRWPKELP
jgi:hypothetical protein